MIREWKMTRHAAGRAVDMCIPPLAIRDAFEHPDRIYPLRPNTRTGDPRFGHHPRKMYVKGKVALIVEVTPSEEWIVTVIWDHAKTGQVSRIDEGPIYDEGGWIDY